MVENLTGEARATAIRAFENAKASYQDLQLALDRLEVVFNSPVSAGAIATAIEAYNYYSECLEKYRKLPVKYTYNTEGNDIVVDDKIELTWQKYCGSKLNRTEMIKFVAKKYLKSLQDIGIQIGDPANLCDIDFWKGMRDFGC